MLPRISRRMHTEVLRVSSEYDSRTPRIFVWCTFHTVVLLLARDAHSCGIQVEAIEMNIIFFSFPFSVFCKCFLVATTISYALTAIWLFLEKLVKAIGDESAVVIRSHRSTSAKPFSFSFSPKCFFSC